MNVEHVKLKVPV